MKLLLLSLIFLLLSGCPIDNRGGFPKPPVTKYYTTWEFALTLRDHSGRQLASPFPDDKIRAISMKQEGRKLTVTRNPWTRETYRLPASAAHLQTVKCCRKEFKYEKTGS